MRIARHDDVHLRIRPEADESWRRAHLSGHGRQLHSPEVWVSSPPALVARRPRRADGPGSPESISFGSGQGALSHSHQPAVHAFSAHRYRRQSRRIACFRTSKKAATLPAPVLTPNSRAQVGTLRRGSDRSGLSVVGSKAVIRFHARDHARSMESRAAGKLAAKPSSASYQS